MMSSFLSQEYVALALIKAKFEIFDESFVTTSELNQFTIFIQREFNERELGIAIVNKLSIEDFNVECGIVTVSDKCCYDLNRISDEILDVLTDKSLILKFFMIVENKKLEILKDLQQKNIESSTRDKIMSLVLPKEPSKEISNLNL